MEKQNKSAFQRVLAVALTLIMVVGMLPMNVIALDVDDRATVTPIGGGVAVDDGNGNITVTVTEAALDWRAATTEHGEGWWVGVCVNAPESMTEEELALATYTVDGGLPEFFVTKSGGASYIQFWLPVTEEFLTAGISETDLYEFNWNGLGDNNQTVTLTVVPSENIVLNPRETEPEPETVTLTVSKTGNGTVKVNGTEVTGSSVDVLKDTAVLVEVAPVAGYQITSLTVGGVSKTVEGSYAENVTFSDDGSVEATFVKVYTVTVQYDENGSVTVDGEEIVTGGSVTVVEGTDDLILVATPNAADGYVVSSVKINGANEELAEYNTYKLTKNQDYTVEIAFAKKTFMPKVTTSEGGRVVMVVNQETVLPGPIEHGTDAVFKIIPDDGWAIKEVKLDGEPVTSEDQGDFIVLVERVQKEPEIEATFVKSEEVANVAPTDVISGAVRVIEASDNTPLTFVYRTDSAVQFSTDQDGIRVTYGSDNQKKGGIGTKSFALNQYNLSDVIEIRKVEIYYQQEDAVFPSWHTVTQLSTAPGAYVQIVPDTALPAVEVAQTADADGNPQEFSSSDVNVEILATDVIPGAGIASIKYEIFKDGAADPDYTRTIYSYAEGNEILDYYRETITVDAETYNQSRVTVRATVTDRAGNVAAGETIFAINTEAPTLTVEEESSEKLHGASDGCYQSRTIRVTITDWSETFDEVAACSGITNNGIPIAMSRLNWQHNEDTHFAIITVDTDGAYNLAFSYTNKAGLGAETNFAENAWEFVVDRTAPTGEIGYGNKWWEQLLTILTFGIWRSEETTITVRNASDDLSGIKEVKLYKDNSETILTEENLEELYNSGEFKHDSITVNTNEQYVVYARIMDNAGNMKYISTEGMGFDNTPSVITISPEGGQDAYGKAIIKVTITVSDTKDEQGKDVEFPSGVKKVTYQIGKKGNTNVGYDSSEQEGPGIMTWSQDVYANPALADENGKVKIVVETEDYAGNVRREEYSVSFDTTAPSITLFDNGAEVAEQTAYNATCGSDIPFDIKVSDVAEVGSVISGITSIDYWIVKDGDEENPTQSDILYESEPKTEWGPEPVIKVDTEKNNSSEVILYIRATDKVGNTTTKEWKLDIDVTAPNIDVSYDNNASRNGTYYNSSRTATITITERDNHFSAEDATNAIVITAEDGYGNAIDIPVVSDWVYTQGNTPDEDTHTATITYDADANYTFSITYTDKAGNISNMVTEEFTVDKTAPVGETKPDDVEQPWVNSITATATFATGDEYSKTWYTLVSDLTFGFWTNKEITVSGQFGDKTAGIESVQYFESNSNSGLTKDDLAGITGWTPFTGLEYFPNKQVTVYFKITDKAGNVGYLSTNGMILDNEVPDKDYLGPDIEIHPEEPANRIYNSDVSIKIEVKDPRIDGVYSGLKSITYQVLNMGVESDEVTLYSFNVENPVQGDLLQKWTGNITVSKDNNSNNVLVVVKAEDNAGNITELEYPLKIDTKAPEVKVEYKDNGAVSGNYYNDNRTAIITVTERNFDFKGISVKVNDTVVEIPKEDWTTIPGTGNGDNTEHKTELVFDADGEYTLEVVSCEDLAGNKNDGVAPSTFTIDKTVPTIEVFYTNNDARNDRYFKEARTATITITEQNFDENLVEITQTAAQGGVTPNVAWTHNGDTHVATLTYSVDGVYTFDITAKDKAGNESGAANFGGSAAAKDFVIDTTYEDMVTIGGVENGKAYGYGETPIPTVQIEDINLDEYNIKLTGIQKDKTIDLTDEVYALLNAGAQEVNGTFDIFQVVQDLDGIYTLSVYGLDKAGNEDREEVTFTVNRFGSVYVYNDYLMGLIAGGGTHTPKVTDDLVITEYNAAKLLAGSLVIEITRDGRPLEDPIYEATPEINDSVAVGESGWYQYRYTISKENFTSDGVYKITVSSKDAAGNAAENNNYDGMSITFRVDSTAPEITSVVGLEEAIIDATQVTVKYTAYDTLGLKSIQVYVDDVLVDEITDFSADLSNYSGSFSLTEKNAAQHVRIVVEDLSGNVTDTDSEYFVSAYEFHKDVTVSTNIFVQWFANKGLFWGSIAGVAAVAGLVIFLIVKKRKKA